MIQNKKAGVVKSAWLYLPKLVVAAVSEMLKSGHLGACTSTNLWLDDYVERVACALTRQNRL